MTLWDETSRQQANIRLGDEYMRRRYKNGGMQLVTWAVLAVVAAVSFIAGAIWAGW